MKLYPKSRQLLLHSIDDDYTLILQAYLKISIRSVGEIKESDTKIHKS